MMKTKLKQYGKIFALVMLVLAGMVLVGLIVTRAPAEDQQADQTEAITEENDVALIEQEADRVKLLLEEGDFAGANDVIEQVIAEEWPAADVADALSKVASAYEKVDIDQAKALATYVVDTYGDTAAARKMRFVLDRYAIEAMIDEGDVASAEKALEQFWVSHAGQSKLPRQLYCLARRYCRQGHPQEAATLYSAVAANYPDSQSGENARLRAAQCSIFAMQSADTADADTEQAIAQLENDHIQHPDLVEVLSEIAEQYLYQGQPAKAAKMLADYRSRYPGDENQDFILMNLAISAVYTDEKAVVRSTLDQLIRDYSDRGDKIANALFGVANHYRMQGDYEQERRLYRSVCRQWVQEEEPTFYQQWARVYSQITSGRQRDVDQQIETLMAACPEDDRASKYVYWLGNACHRVGDIERACRLYQEAIDRWPTDGWALSSRLALILLDPTMDQAGRTEWVDSFVNDFYGHKHYATAAYRTACDLYRNAEQKQREGLRDQAREDSETVLRAIAIVDGQAYDRGVLAVKQELETIKAYCLYQLDRDEQAIAVCDEFITDWPNSQGQMNLQLVKARCLQRVTDPNAIDSVVQVEIETAYRTVLADAADPIRRAQATKELAWFYLGSHQPVKAAEYFEYFLATSERLGNSRDDAAFALRQVYLELDQPTLAEDVSKEFFRQPTAGSEILGGDARLATLQGT